MPSQTNECFCVWKQCALWMKRLLDKWEARVFHTCRGTEVNRKGCVPSVDLQETCKMWLYGEKQCHAAIVQITRLNHSGYIYIYWSGLGSSLQCLLACCLPRYIFKLLERGLFAQRPETWSFDGAETVRNKDSWVTIKSSVAPRRADTEDSWVSSGNRWNQITARRFLCFLTVRTQKDKTAAVYTTRLILSLSLFFKHYTLAIDKTFNMLFGLKCCAAGLFQFPPSSFFFFSPTFQFKTIPSCDLEIAWYRQRILI